MRVGFVRNAIGEIVSAMVPKASMPAVLVEGETVTLCSPLELEIATVPEGTKANVLMHCRDTGAVELEFSAPVPGLHTWGNTLLLIPFATEDALAALNYALQRNPNGVISIHGEEPAKVVSFPKKPRAYMRHVNRLAAVLALTVACGALYGSMNGTAEAINAPALEWKSLVAENSEVKPGDTLMLVAQSRHNHACAWVFSGSWYNISTATVVARAHSPGVARQTESEFHLARVPVSVPANLKPGRYEYQPLARGDCNGDGFLDTVLPAPIVHVTVRKNDQTS